MGENYYHALTPDLQRSARSAKRRGELVEVAFLHKAVSLGFGVAKPYGDSEPYDFILDAAQSGISHLWRVQVKSTTCKRHDAYHLCAGHFPSPSGKTRYTPDEIDFLVACIVPEQIWYVLPILAFAPRQYLRLYPHRKLKPKRSRYEEYQDAWRLMSHPRALTEISSGTSAIPNSFASSERERDRTMPIDQ
jgi:hypothetical protein